MTREGSRSGWGRMRQPPGRGAAASGLSRSEGTGRSYQQFRYQGSGPGGAFQSQETSRFESMIRNMQQFPDKIPNYSEAWESYMRSVFATSPFLDAHLDKHPDWYIPELQKYRKQ